jgi:enolase-phosphatase E1
MPTFTGISHLLLDIEGTTCPVSFVAEVLFPYAAQKLHTFVQDQSNNPTVQNLLADVQEAWQNDKGPEAEALWRTAQTEQQLPSLAASTAYLQLLIRQDRKLTPLKDLQGLIWREGYASGELVAPLYPDVAPALLNWHRAGLVLGVYSSGSVGAQKLLYGHCVAGDLTDVFSHWFDTRIGSKQQSESYQLIADAMNCKAENILFISDALTECQAAKKAGFKILFSKRSGNPQTEPGPFQAISNYAELRIESAANPPGTKKAT